MDVGSASARRAPCPVLGLALMWTFVCPVQKGRPLLFFPVLLHLPHPHTPSSLFRGQSPLFLLFLDATWQLLEQQPAAFEFSETYLAVVLDSSRLSLFGTFLFNSPHQRVQQSTVRAARDGQHCSWCAGGGQQQPRGGQSE